MEVLGVARYYEFRPPAISGITGDSTGDSLEATSERWYGEYSQSFACRLFAIRSDGVAVAPYDIAFIEARGMGEPPSGQVVRNISFRMFEQLWEEAAQPRLRMLAHTGVAPLPSIQVLYVKEPFPAAFKHNEPSSDLYTEWVNAVARRHFEVFPDHVVVATHDPEAVWPEHFESLPQAIELGIDDIGRPIDPLLRPIALSHATFEEAWEKYALKRLRELAGLAQP